DYYCSLYMGSDIHVLF
nr:immunoglobulin light chain junction region [Macaca mulatta]